jgi:hypothetical protein
MLAKSPNCQPGLWSLWDMLELKIGRLIEIHELLVIEKGHFEQAKRYIEQGRLKAYEFGKRHLAKLRSSVQELAGIADAAGLYSTYQAASRTTQFLAQVDLPDGYVLEMDAEACGNAFLHLTDLCSRIRDDSAARIYYQITPEGAKFLDAKASHFGPDVERVFGSGDISEAAACLALERGTASVFHLMRALEAAAQVVADKIGAAIKDEHGKTLPWGVIASNMKGKIDKMPKGSAEQIKWYRVQSQLEAVNRAWRVPTAHPGETYTPEQARAVFNATQSFMQELTALV